MEVTTLLQASRTGKTKVLKIWTKGSVIHRRWGILDGKMQESEKIVKGKNAGKANATTDVEQAGLEAQRIITRKINEGYHREGEVENNGFSFNPLPTSFAPSKPHCKKPKDLESNMGGYCAERKNNGVNLLRVVDEDNNNHLYTRGIKEITEITRNILILQGFNSIPLKPCSIVSFEFVVCDENGKESPKDLRGLVSDKTTTEKATKKYKVLMAEGYTFSIRVFDVLFYNGEDITATDYIDRRRLLEKLIWGIHPKYRSEFFFKFTFDAIEIARKRGWEGYVLRKLKGPDSTVEFTMNGKPHRRGAWKYVFEKRGDFVITEIQIGAAGRLSGLPARFHLGQYYDGELIDCQWAGPGKVKTSDLIALAKDLGLTSTPKSVHKISGLTAEVVFRNRQETDALEFPVIQRIRDDKPVKECLYE